MVSRCPFKIRTANYLYPTNVVLSYRITFHKLSRYVKKTFLSVQLPVVRLPWRSATMPSVGLAIFSTFSKYDAPLLGPINIIFLLNVLAIYIIISIRICERADFGSNTIGRVNQTKIHTTLLNIFKSQYTSL